MTGIDQTWRRLWQRRGQKSWCWLRFYPFALLRAYMKERVPEDAQAMVYITLLTLVPLLAVAFSLLRGFGVQGVLEPWLHEMFAPMGHAGEQVVAYLLQFVNQTNASGLGIIGVVVLFISVINMAQKIEVTLNRIWHVEIERSLKSRISGYISAVILAPLLIGAIMSMMLGMKNAVWLQPYLHTPGVEVVFNLLTGLLPMVIVYVVIMCTYAWIPNCKVKWRAACGGAAFFLLLWYPVSWLFSRFIAGSAKYSVIYSSFASMVILLFWLYFLWLLFLFGAKVASLIQMPYCLSPYEENDWYADEQMLLSFAVMRQIDHAFAHAKPAPTVADLNLALHTTPGKIGFLLARLYDAGLLYTTDDKPARYLPSKARQHYSLLEVYQALCMPQDAMQLPEADFAVLRDKIAAQLDVPLTDLMSVENIDK